MSASYKISLIELIASNVAQKEQKMLKNASSNLENQRKTATEGLAIALEDLKMLLVIVGDQAKMIHLHGEVRDNNLQIPGGVLIILEGIRAGDSKIIMILEEEVPHQVDGAMIKILHRVVGVMISPRILHQEVGEMSNPRIINHREDGAMINQRILHQEDGVTNNLKAINNPEDGVTNNLRLINHLEDGVVTNRKILHQEDRVMSNPRTINHPEDGVMSSPRTINHQVDGVMNNPRTINHQEDGAMNNPRTINHQEDGVIINLLEDRVIINLQEDGDKVTDNKMVDNKVVDGDPIIFKTMISHGVKIINNNKDRMNVLDHPKTPNAKILTIKARRNKTSRSHGTPEREGKSLYPLTKTEI